MANYTEVENEITTWKFKTRLVLIVVFCSGFVPVMLWEVRMAAALLCAAAGPSHNNLIVAGFTELALSIGALIFIASALAISVGHALRNEAKAIEVETPKTITIAYPPRVGSVA